MINLNSVLHSAIDLLGDAALQHVDCSTVMCFVDFEDSRRSLVLKMDKAKSNSCVHPRLQPD